MESVFTMYWSGCRCIIRRKMYWRSKVTVKERERTLLWKFRRRWDHDKITAGRWRGNCTRIHAADRGEKFWRYVRSADGKDRTSCHWNCRRISTGYRNIRHSDAGNQRNWGDWRDQNILPENLFYHYVRLWYVWLCEKSDVTWRYGFYYEACQHFAYRLGTWKSDGWSAQTAETMGKKSGIQGKIGSRRADHWERNDLFDLISG